MWVTNCGTHPAFCLWQKNSESESDGLSQVVFTQVWGHLIPGLRAGAAPLGILGVPLGMCETSRQCLWSSSPPPSGAKCKAEQKQLFYSSAGAAPEMGRGMATPEIWLDIPLSRNTVGYLPCERWDRNLNQQSHESMSQISEVQFVFFENLKEKALYCIYN